MLDPVVQSALVVLVAWLLEWACKLAGIAIDPGVLHALAAAIVAWLVGVALGQRAAAGLRASFRARG